MYRNKFLFTKRVINFVKLYVVAGGNSSSSSNSNKDGNKDIIKDIIKDGNKDIIKDGNKEMNMMVD